MVNLGCFPKGTLLSTTETNLFRDIDQVSKPLAGMILIFPVVNLEPFLQVDGRGVEKDWTQNQFDPFSLCS